MKWQFGQPLGLYALMGTKAVMVLILEEERIFIQGPGLMFLWDSFETTIVDDKYTMARYYYHHEPSVLSVLTVLYR